MEKIKSIIDFWFGDLIAANLPSSDRTQLWFNASTEFDSLIQQQFEQDVIMAGEGKYRHWENSAQGCLALIILLDQFPRNIYRNTSKAFQYDQQALSLCLYGLKQNYNNALSLIERVFFYMPLEHAEKLELQQLSVAKFQELVQLALPEAKPMFQIYLDYSITHYEIIKKFSRFPYRNAALERESTKEEIEFLSKNTF